MEETDPDFPTGCYYHNYEEYDYAYGNYAQYAEVYCNKHSIGASEEDSSPICKVWGIFILESILSSTKEVLHFII